MCHLSKKDQYVCQINQGIAEAVTGVLGGAQFPSGPFYHPRSSRCRLRHTREAAVCAGNVPDSNGISDDFKRQKRSHQTEPVPLPLVFQGKMLPMLLARSRHLHRLEALLTRHPIVGLLGARQVGKTTLARQLVARFSGPTTIFDLENPADLARLDDPLLALQGLAG